MVFIQNYVARIKDLSEKGREVCVYFNSTIDGALDNAKSLKNLLC